MVEVPLLFETGMEAVFDATVAVVAAGRDCGPSAPALAGPPSSRARGGRQLPQDEKAAPATHVISNDGGIDELERAIGRLVAELSQEAA